MPVLAIGGAKSFGEHVAEAMRLVADDVQGVVVPGAGHFVAEEAPEELLAALPPSSRRSWHDHRSGHRGTARLTTLSAFDRAPVWLNSEPLTLQVGAGSSSSTSGRTRA